MEHFSFVTKIPHQPGSLHRAVEIVNRYGANIKRIHYDRRIDPLTVFFEVGCIREAFEQLTGELDAIGYLRTSIGSLSFLKIHVHLPHRQGALDEFLTCTTGAGANIVSIDFDDSGRNPDRVTVGLNVEESGVVDSLLNTLKSRYPLEIVEYDTTGEKLDDTVFYVRFAQKILPLTGGVDEGFLLDFLHDINHTVQQLQALGEDPKNVFRNVLEAGRFLDSTTGDGFYADVQKIVLNDQMNLFCFQLPGGGSIFIFETPEERIMLDTGYGIYHRDAMMMFRAYGLGDNEKLKFIITSHGDADHCGAGGYFDVPAFMHHGTKEIIDCGNRAWGSRNEESVLEKVYTTMIALFSRWNPPKDEYVSLLPEAGPEKRNIFPVLHRFTFGGLDFEILESLGGHQFGQLILFCPEKGLLFTADSLMNFSSLTEERKRYNSYADYLVTSVNVDSALARTERKALMDLAQDYEKEYGRPCLICGGHGSVSVLKDGRLSSFGEVEHYTHTGN